MYELGSGCFMKYIGKDLILVFAPGSSLRIERIQLQSIQKSSEARTKNARTKNGILDWHWPSALHLTNCIWQTAFDKARFTTLTMIVWLFVVYSFNPDTYSQLDESEWCPHTDLWSICKQTRLQTWMSRAVTRKRCQVVTGFHRLVSKLDKRDCSDHAEMNVSRCHAQEMSGCHRGSTGL